MPKDRSELLQGTLDLMVLKTLDAMGPLHGYGVARRIEQMKDYLKPGGAILLAGEPVSTAPIPEIPFPWGFRIDWENIAVMRQRGWMELGFQQPYLYHMFARAGFKGELFTEVNSHWAQVYRFTRSE